MRHVQLGNRDSQDVAQLFEENLRVLAQIKTNMQAYRVDDNTPLLVQLLKNIRRIQELFDLNPGMQEMHPIPFAINPEADNFLGNIMAHRQAAMTSPLGNPITGSPHLHCPCCTAADVAEGGTKYGQVSYGGSVGEGRG